MRITAETKFAEWCHFCGKRSTGPFIEVWYPDNAEHETNDSHYLRFCEACSHRIYELTAEQQANRRRDRARKAYGRD
jgi:hypothetical protein